ncbi:MAG TPA: 16S rRNA (cytidine(1402)-2'-O)-methyltransferase [Patescibacteria group bacterium]|nr:16S rRNA (cytidine(1402)-2'-O)-methyltransferase [Patescibacteria group bacterium]
MGRLYLVSTPIGNRDDLTLRALRLLFEVDVILSEDTRKTGQLLKLCRPDVAHPPLLSFFEGNEESRLEEILVRLEAGQKIALVSSAGTPLVSDPGFKLVRVAITAGHEVIPVPGASAALAALVGSGLPPDKFLFLGFLPKKEGKKEKLLKTVIEAKAKLPQTVIGYESPFRLVKTIELLARLAPDTDLVLAKELTKKFEAWFRGKPNQVLAKLPTKIKGEWVVMF